MSGNILPRGYVGGFGLTIGNVFGRIAGNAGGQGGARRSRRREGGELMQQSKLMREGEHMMTVCNACRYCEGFCAVWPAMEFRRKFAEGD